MIGKIQLSSISHDFKVGDKVKYYENKALTELIQSQAPQASFTRYDDTEWTIIDKNDNNTSLWNQSFGRPNGLEGIVWSLKSDKGARTDLVNFYLQPVKETLNGKDCICTPNQLFWGGCNCGFMK